jgi:type III secretion system (T3SS) inner membrane Yop/YscD-like protein
VTDFCYLEVLEGPQAGLGAVLDDRFLYEVGAGEGCHLILDDTSVEEVHAQLYVEQGQLVVVPLRGETRVNEHQIDESVFLVAGDSVAFGAIRLSYEPLEEGGDLAQALSDTFMPGADTEPPDLAALAETGVLEGGESPTFFDIPGDDDDDWDLDEDLPGLDRDHQAVVERLRIEAAELRIQLAAAKDTLARQGGGEAEPEQAERHYEERLAEAREEAESQAREVVELKELLRAFGQRARRERTTLTQRNQDLEARVRQLSARCQALLNQAKRADSAVVERGAPRVASGTERPQAAPRRRRGAVSMDSILERADARPSKPAPKRAPKSGRKGAVSMDSIFDRAAKKDSE